MITRKKLNDDIIMPLHKSFKILVDDVNDFSEKYEISEILFAGFKVQLPKKYKISIFNLNRYTGDYKAIMKLYKAFIGFQMIGINKTNKKFGLIKCYEDFEHDYLEFNFNDLIDFEYRSYDRTSTVGMMPGMNQGQYMNSLLVADSVNRFNYGIITLSLNNYEPISFQIVTNDEFQYQKLVSYCHYIMANKQNKDAF